jgi:hypothetical protein
MELSNIIKLAKFIEINREDVFLNLKDMFQSKAIKDKYASFKEIPSNIIFGIGGIIILTNDRLFIYNNQYSWSIHSFNNLSVISEKGFWGYDYYIAVNSKPLSIYNVGNIKVNGCEKILIALFDLLKDIQNTYLNEIENARIEEIRRVERERLDSLDNKISETILQLDKNKDGIIDLIENDFNKLFSKNQKRVMDMDKNYIHQFVKVSNFIKTKKQNTQKIFESIRDTSTQVELEERVNLLKNQIHAYELLVFHSINMIGALVSEDLITFYDIYESFDKLGMFNSNWENEVSEKLTNIGDKLDDLMQSIYNMEQNIVSELSYLSYVTQESFDDLNRSVTSQLREVESSINTNNLLTGIQAYQLYKINKNTKSLRN